MRCLIFRSNRWARGREADFSLFSVFVCNCKNAHLVRKLKETLVTVQQLDKNMSNLRTWLSRIEAELAKPVVYSVCHGDEIQRKLAEQQDLQRDIEQHTESVASVLTLCDVLLHDTDACGGDSENDSIQQTTRSLDRRWRNICAMSMERRMRIEETWRLWCKFLDDYSRFEDWLTTAELTTANPDSADVLYTSAKEELKKFEAFQRQVHERLTQLELVNKLYRRLARENRTDAASKLKVTVHEGNQRWDGLQRRVAAVLRRLKHFTSQREDFEGTREGILVWLTEMDLQLTNVEHFSESDVEDKMRQLNGFQQEITLNTNKIDALIVFGENLIQKSAPLDAVLIEDELEELHSYCQEVFGRVARFHQRLVNRRPVLEEEEEEEEEEERELKEGVRAAGGVSAGRQTACQLLAPPPERSGRETPVSVDSIPLEWDHTVDVGGSSSHEDDDEDASFFSALSGNDPRLPGEETSSQTNPSRPELVPHTHQHHQQQQQQLHHSLPPAGLRKNTHTKICNKRRVFIRVSDVTSVRPQAKLMSECSGSIDTVKRVKLILNGDEEEGVTLFHPAETKTDDSAAGVIERWELLQAQKFHRESDVKQDLEQWQQLNSDLCDLTSWLGRMLPELERVQRIAPATGIRDIEDNIRMLKVTTRTNTKLQDSLIWDSFTSIITYGDGSELRELREAVSSANLSWTQACGGLESWETRLRSALMQCQEFHETLHSLLLWLSQAENKLCAANVGDLSTSRSDLQLELRGRQPQVSSLQDISAQLLLEATADDSSEAKEKVHVIGNKLRLLLRQAAAELLTQQLLLFVAFSAFIVKENEAQREAQGHRWESTPRPRGTSAHPPEPQGSTIGMRESPPRRPLFYRVLRAAFPLHLLFLLLLVVACLLPPAEDDYSCTLSNNFARSFYPMLRYTNGPPPT
uniref:Spectrin repeat containing, nuclear envelope 2b n=1 Tax=Scophthalmus maximus TaxID=52904 RepID=A0A8D3EBL2_SCOMX